MILSVESGEIASGYRIRVRDLDSEDELTVEIPAGVLSSDELLDIQNGEWYKLPLRMQIEVARIGTRVVKATLVSLKGVL